MANKRQLKKKQVKQAQSPNYNKLLNEYSKYVKTFERQGVTISSTFPKLSEYNKLNNKQKVEVFEKLNNSVSVVKKYQGRKDSEAKKNLREQGIKYSSQNDSVKPATKDKIEKAGVGYLTKESREKLKNDILKKEGIEERKRNTSKDNIKSREVIEDKSKDTSNIFRKYSYNKYRKQYNKLAMDASRYGIQLDSINPEDIAKMISSPEGLNKFKKVQFTDRLSNRFTSKETVIQKIQDLGINIKYMDDRSKPISYEEIQKYKKLRNKYNEKKKVFDTNNEALAELSKPKTLKDYLLSDTESRESEKEKLKSVTGIRNKELKKASKDIKSDTRKELVEKDLIKYNNTKGKRNLIKASFEGFLDVTKELIKGKDMETNEIDNKTDEDTTPKRKAFINIQEVVDSNTIYSDIYTDDGSVVEGEKWNILEDENIREMFEQELESLGIDPVEYYKMVRQNEELDSYNTETEVEEVYEQIESRIEELENGEKEETKETEYILDSETSLDDILAEMEVVEVVEPEYSEEDLKRIAGQKHKFIPPTFEKTSYVFNQTESKFDNFLNLISHKSIREGSSFPRYKGILTVFSDKTMDLLDSYSSVFEEKGYTGYDINMVRNNFFELLSMEDINSLLPLEFHFESTQQDIRFQMLPDDLVYILWNLEDKIREVLENAEDEDFEVLFKKA